MRNLKFTERIPNLAVIIQTKGSGHFDRVWNMGFVTQTVLQFHFLNSECLCLSSLNTQVVFASKNVNNTLYELNHLSKVAFLRNERSDIKRNINSLKNQSIESL